MRQQFLNWTIRLRSKNDIDICEVVQWPGSSVVATDEVLPLIDNHPWNEWQKQLKQMCERSEKDETFLKKVGLALSSLLPPSIIESFWDAYATIKTNGQRLRVRLYIEQPKLAALPWEYLCIGKPSANAASRNIRVESINVAALSVRQQLGFLGLHPQISIVRQPNLSLPKNTITSFGEMHILVVVACPISLNWTWFDIQSEPSRIREMLSPFIKSGKVKLSFLGLNERATPDALCQKLKQANEDLKGYHLLHFAGHGFYKLMTRQPPVDAPVAAGLVLVKDDGQPAYLLSGKLLKWLQDSSIRIVVLSACQTAGVAQMLSAGGIPAVVAMQFPISDSAALKFSKGFYDSLTAYEPIDVCVLRGREAITYHMGKDNPYWGVPSVFLQSETGVLFQSSEQQSVSEHHSSIIHQPQEWEETTTLSAGIMENQDVWLNILQICPILAGRYYLESGQHDDTIKRPLQAALIKQW